MSKPIPPGVFGWQADEGGCFHYRVKLPLDMLATQGHRATYGMRLAGQQHEHSIVVGQRIAKTGPAVNWQHMANRGRNMLVYELDDDLYNIHPSSERPYYFYTHPETVDTVTGCLKLADLVTVSTEPLAQQIRQHNPNVVVLPNCVDESILSLPPAPLDIRGPDDKPLDFAAQGMVTVGYTSSPTHLHDFQMIRDQLVLLSQRQRNMVYLWFGESYELPVPTVSVGWISDMTAYYQHLNFDIGIAPLAPTLFNQSKCVDAETMLTTKRGVVSAASTIAGDSVWHGGRWVSVLATEQGLPRPGVAITTKDGYQIRLTPEHRMLVNGKWTCAGGIQTGDRMATEPEAVGPARYVSVPWPAEVRKSSRPDADHDTWQTAMDGPRLKITPRWGRIFGAYLGDGSVNGTVVAISCDGQDQDWIDRLMDDFRSVGLYPSTETITTWDGKPVRRRTVRVASAHLVRLLVYLGMARIKDNGRPKRVTTIPGVIWESPQDVIVEFLAGYFEADGGCARVAVHATSKDQPLIRGMQRLLLLLGIESRVWTRRYTCTTTGFNDMYWGITLRRAAVDLFAKEIGFRSARKQASLAAIVRNPASSPTYRPMQWEQEVTAVEPCWLVPIDLQVEGEVFAAAGFVSHNSHIKALEYAARGIPVVASDEQPYREFVRHGETGFLAKQPYQFGRYLRDLVNDPQMRTEMGQKARELAGHHTIQQHWGLWADAYGLGG